MTADKHLTRNHDGDLLLVDGDCTTLVARCFSPLWHAILQFPGNEEKALRDALGRVIKSTHSHVDGRDLLAQLHPRHTLDIKRRVDGRETWYEGDWLSDVRDAIEGAKRVLAGEPFDLPRAAARGMQGESAGCGQEKRNG